MTNEDKQLLLKDLCARLPYGVKAKCTNIAFVDNLALSEKDLECIVIDSIDTASTEIAFSIEHDFGCAEINSIRPYLRPISSMTESEIDKLFDVLHIDKDGNDEDWIKINDVVGIKFFFPTGKWVENVAEAYDYLNSIHIDYRGLIPMGLALEAPEGMY